MLNFFSCHRWHDVHWCKRQYEGNSSNWWGSLVDHRLQAAHCCTVEDYPSLWVHVDAAWAGVALACHELREQLYLDDINAFANSFCTNFHKVIALLFNILVTWSTLVGIGELWLFYSLGTRQEESYRCPRHHSAVHEDQGGGCRFVRDSISPDFFWSLSKALSLTIATGTYRLVADSDLSNCGSSFGLSALMDSRIISDA